MFLEGRRDEDAGPFVIRNAVGGAVVARAAEGAFSRAARRRGLLGRTHLPDGHALLIAPCWSIHTFFMQFPIDVVFVARDGRVVKTRARMPASRLSAAPGAYAVVELPAGVLEKIRVSVGDRLDLEPAS